MLHALCYLTVTRQPAINVGILLIMTFQAHPHPPILGRQPLKVFYQSVAFPAVYFGVDVALMIEKHVFRYVVYLDPGCRGSSIEIFVLFLDLRVFFDYVIVTVQALFHRRYAREI